MSTNYAFILDTATHIKKKKRSLPKLIVLVIHVLWIIFSQVLACLFIFLMIYFNELKFLILMKADLSMFPFMVIVFWVITKIPLPTPVIIQIFSYVSILKLFLVFTFRIMTSLSFLHMLWGTVWSLFFMQISAPHF